MRQNSLISDLYRCSEEAAAGGVDISTDGKACSLLHKVSLRVFTQGRPPRHMSPARLKRLLKDSTFFFCIFTV